MAAQRAVYYVRAGRNIVHADEARHLDALRIDMTGKEHNKYMAKPDNFVVREHYKMHRASAEK
jgi:hypothetical protein